MIAFRAAAILFAGATVLAIVLFVRALSEREIRSGLATYAAFTAAAAVGLWRRRRWGRGLALVIALGNVGVGVLSLLAVILARRGPVAGPIVLIVTSGALAYALSRPVFSFSDEH